MKQNSAVIIPALEPEENLVEYIQKLIDSGIRKIIVVDDGSGENYKYIFERISDIPECDLITHDINKGKGRALKNAMALYISNGYDQIYNGIITADSDGQHSVEDVLKVSDKLSTIKDALVLGEREFDKDVPFKSKFGNSLTRHIFRLLYGIKLHDTQTGLRGIPNSLLETFSLVSGEQYEYEMNMLIECSRKQISIESVTIQTIYLEENASTHFNPIKDSIKIYKVLLGNFIKYTLSSLSASLIDIAIFKILVIILKQRLVMYILVATVIARICSSLYNFFMNKAVVFKSDKSILITAIKYYVLCIGQMLVSAGLVTLCYSLCPIGETVEKIIIDTLLFFVSYRIQRKFIFS